MQRRVYILQFCPSKRFPREYYRLYNLKMDHDKRTKEKADIKAKENKLMMEGYRRSLRLHRRDHKYLKPG